MPIYKFQNDSPKLPDKFWIAPNAQLIGRVIVGEHTSFWYGVVVRGDNEWIKIGCYTNIQDNCVLHSDFGMKLNIGNYCTIGHSAILHGCTVGDNCLVGMGAVVLNGAKIGKNSFIGANSLVTQGQVVEPGSLMVGTPAKKLRELKKNEIETITKSAQDYDQNWQNHQNNQITK